VCRLRDLTMSALIHSVTSVVVRFRRLLLHSTLTTSCLHFICCTTVHSHMVVVLLSHYPASCERNCSGERLCWSNDRQTSDCGLHHNSVLSMKVALTGWPSTLVSMTPVQSLVYQCAFRHSYMTIMPKRY